MYRLLALLTCLGVAPAMAQGVDFFTGAPAAPAEARVLSVPSTVERELAQIDVLIEAAAWDEAVDAMLKFVIAPSHEVIDLGGGHFVPVAFAAQSRIARWPAEAIAVYRKRVDNTAQSLYQRGIDGHDANALLAVVDQYRASSFGDDALLALADFALEAGATNQARGYLLQIAPGASAPDGRPWGVALAGLNLNDQSVRDAIATQVAKPQVGDQADSVYPDTDLLVADIFARLAMVSIRERNIERAERELAVLRLTFPDASGLIGGRESNLADAIASALDAARNWPSPNVEGDWPTYGGSPARGGVAPAIGELYGTVWQRELTAPDVGLRPNNTELWLNGNRLMQRVVPPPRKTFTYPLVSDHAVVWKDNGQWLAARVSDGKPLFGDAGVLDGKKRQQPVDTRVSRPGVNREAIAVQQGNVIIGGNAQIQIRVNNGPPIIQGGRAVFGDIGPTPAEVTLEKVPLAMADDELLYVLSDTSAAGVIYSPNAPPPAKRLLALDLGAEGKHRVEIAPEKGLRISGPPVVIDQRVYVPVRDSAAGGRVAIACYVRTTGRQLWQAPVASMIGETEPAETDLIVYGEGMLYLPTDGGVITAVRASDGQVMWARTYQRGTTTEPNDLSQVATRERGAYLLADGTLICGPADAASLFALDPITGRVLWENREAWDIEQLLGVVEGRLVATGRQLWLIDPTSGRTQFAWPDNAAANITGSGRGCIAGSEIFWPTKEHVYAFDAKTAQQSRTPISLEDVDLVGGANLIPCSEGLIVATEKHLTLLGKPLAAKQPAEPAKPALSFWRPPVE
ncbi:outer membrane protein assembly factor BamB family protein [Aeoliella sp. SH292]|uniref:outer membrane protein assembly factor BamB family protein n=1 Tax=Aeoliella sp. SH292 TaxID=3454464 RepID=UPI003F9655E2